MISSGISDLKVNHKCSGNIMKVSWDNALQWDLMTEIPDFVSSAQNRFQVPFLLFSSFVWVLSYW